MGFASNSELVGALDFGADQRALSNAKALERTFKIFPVSPGHPAPDAMHFVLDLLLFAVLGTLAIGLFLTSRKQLRPPNKRVL